MLEKSRRTDHDLLRFYLPPEARWGVISGRDTHQWPLDDRGRSTRPHDIGEHLTRAVRVSCAAESLPFRRHRPRGLSPPSATASATSTRPSSLTWWRPSPIPDTGSAWPTCSPTSWAVPTSTCSANLPKVPARARASSSRPPRSASSWPTSCVPRPGEDCHDYACGSAGLLVKLQLVARELDPTSRVPLKLDGQELQADSYAVAHMNAIIHDMEVRKSPAATP